MSQSGSKNSLPALTGLRFVAAMLVWACHVPVYFPGVPRSSLDLGQIGVSFFFVLSGFILTFVYHSRESGFSKTEFYLRRLARVWPLHVVTMVLVLVGVLTLHHQFAKPYGELKTVFNFLLLQSWIPDRSWVFSINGPSWSLSVEAFFYLMFPWLLAGGQRPFIKKSCWLGVTMIGLLVLLASNQVTDSLNLDVGFFLHTNPLLRLSDFIAGMACGFFYLRLSSSDPPIRRDFAQFAACAICVGYFWMIAKLDFDPVPSRQATAEVLSQWALFRGGAPLFAFIIFAFARWRGWLADILSTRTMVYLGEISYAFYLIHQPVLVQLRRFGLAESPYAAYWMAGSSLLLSVVAAMLLHHLIELPSRVGIIGLFRNGTRSPMAFFSSLARYPVTLFNFFRQPFAAFVGVLLAVGFAMLQQGRFDYSDSGAIRDVMTSTPQEFQSVQFDDDAILQGLTSDLQPDGWCQLRMVWDLKSGRRPIRFIHICDQQGEILRQSNANARLFQTATSAVTVLDVVKLSPADLQSAAMVAVGFYGPERKSAPIINRRPGQGSHRFVVWKSD